MQLILKPDSPFKELYEQALEDPPAGTGTLIFDQKVSLELNGLRLDPEIISKQFLYRLKHASKGQEAAARAVCAGFKTAPLVFDATAGLGRDSMILARCGAKVMMFERQPALRILLKAALMTLSAQSALLTLLPQGLPQLRPELTIKDYLGAVRPDVIYFDPMFPERRKSAAVKKDMQVLQDLVGADADYADFLRIALKLARRRVVVKRPRTAPPVIIDNISAHNSIDGGGCRFDCYTALA